MLPSEPAQETKELFYQSLNPNAKSTIVLIHGAFASSASWNLVTPYLQKNYHLLIPDVPNHGHSAHIGPYSTALAATSIAHLIKTHAIHGRAHIVGHSMGAKIAISLCEAFPHVVLSCLVSGFGVFNPSGWVKDWVPLGLWVMTRVENLVPRALMSWVMDGAVITRSWPDLALCANVAQGEMSGEGGWPGSWPARTLIIVAGKGGFPPTADRPQDAIRLAEIGRQMNQETYAVTHPQMRHPWVLQDPSLFAEIVVAWIEEKEIPQDFVKL
ncbi:alpha/beta-hydrolase [Acrodontium crateriforme]|uniref:Alpha/beta-hydrolase n=1 Tax=Acrodontium crateriforme TaxID=150365 RepID=A0AAQ3M180_9PEZI|nr:alpha/beta-hydrolase [Acrodontium crateriforme]